MSWIKDRVGTAAMMRELDGKTINEYGVPGIVLMENAGRQAFEFIMDEFRPRRVMVFAGKGNNGGDGYVIARHLLNAGVEVRVVLLAKKDDVKGDARTNLEAFLKLGGPVHPVLDDAALEDLRFEVERSDLIVDAILGTGIESEVRGIFAEAIGFINAITGDDPGIRVAAVDLPSGLNADTGQVMGAAVRADATITFGMLKTGQLCHPGAALVGTLAGVDISIPRALYETVPHRIITAELAAGLMPCREEDSHKGDVGHGLVLAGSPGKTGAAVMAAESALRAGAGLITLAAPAGLSPILETKTLEVMTEPLPETADGTLGQASLGRAREVLAGKTAAALGPGLGRNAEVTEFVRSMIKECALPLVIDADGLFAVAEDPAMLAAKAGPVVLTPHPGEMARLMGVKTSEVQADRPAAAIGFAGKHGVIVVLKGAHTVVAAPDGRAFFNLTGNPGLASGGTGDVLTGMVLGLICQGIAPLDAAALAVFLHGMAGDLAAEEISEEAMIARDVMERIGTAIKFLDETDEE